MAGHENPSVAPTPLEAVPQQSRRRAPVPFPVDDRIVCQVEAIDAWNTARRARECLLDAACTSRLDQETANRQRDVLRRTQQAITDSTARALAWDCDPLLLPVATAVVAHRHAWFAAQVATQLEARGVTVLECTDNGPDALGAIIAEQPDLVLVGEQLAMMPGGLLLSETRRFAPGAYRAAQTTDPREASAWVRHADLVFFPQQPPAEVAMLLALGVVPRTQHSNA